MEKTEVTFTKNAESDKLLEARCYECKRRTKHRILCSVDENGTTCNYHEGWSIDWVNNFQIIQCQGCETVSFRHLNWFSENCNPECGEDGYTEHLYPHRSDGEIECKQFLHSPWQLRYVYEELISCFNRDCPMLCAAGLRTLVEGICEQQGVVDGPVEVTGKDGESKVIRKNNLQGKIAGLEEKGILTRDSSENLHQHRFLGNDAVHDLFRPTKEELRLAIEIVEHTLYQLYEIPIVADNLRSISAKRHPAEG